MSIWIGLREVYDVAKAATLCRKPATNENSTGGAHQKNLKKSGCLPALEIHLIGFERLAEEESLHVIALLFAQELQLPFIFDALGSDREIQAFCHLNDRGGDCLFIAVAVQVMDEAAIDFELADGELLEIAEAG